MKKDKFLNYLIILQNLILAASPYIFSKRGNHTRNMMVIILVLLVMFSMMAGRKQVIFDKKILIFSLCCMFFMTISFLRLGGTYFGFQLKVYQRTIIAMIMGFCITQIDIKEKIYRYILPFFSLCSFFPIYRGINEWHKSNFGTNVRIFGDNWPTVFPVELGIFLVVSMIVLFYDERKFFKIIAFFSIALGYLVIISTQTRIMIILIPFIFIIVSFIKNYKLGLSLSAGFLLIGIFLGCLNFEKHFQRFSSNNTDGSHSNQIRILTYKRSIEMIKRSKFLGVGFYNFQGNSIKLDPNYKDYIIYENDNTFVNPNVSALKEALKIFAFTNSHSHNNFLEIILAQGILGFLSYVFFIYYLFRSLIKKYKKSSLYLYKRFFVLGIVLLIYILLNGLVEANIYMEKVNQLSFFILGLALNKKFSIENRVKN